MKKVILLLAVSVLIINMYNQDVQAQQTPEPVVKIEIPATSPESNPVVSDLSHAEKAIEATKDATDKTIKATKSATKKTVNATKNATKKTVKATKTATKKTVETTKEITDKTVEGTKDLIDNLNPNKPVTLEGLETEAQIKTLKNERNELKSAYNSRIKDVKAKIKAAEKSTTLSDVQRQNKIYTLNKEKQELELQRDAAVEKYNNRIKKIKEANK